MEEDISALGTGGVDVLSGQGRRGDIARTGTADSGQEGHGIVGRRGIRQWAGGAGNSGQEGHGMVDRRGRSRIRQVEGSTEDRGQEVH